MIIFFYDMRFFSWWKIRYFWFCEIKIMYFWCILLVNLFIMSSFVVVMEEDFCKFNNIWVSLKILKLL